MAKSKNIHAGMFDPPARLPEVAPVRLPEPTPVPRARPSSTSGRAAGRTKAATQVRAEEGAQGATEGQAKESTLRRESPGGRLVLNLPPDLIKRLRHQCVEEARSLSNAAELAIQEWLEASDRGQAEEGTLRRESPGGRLVLNLPPDLIKRLRHQCVEETRSLSNAVELAIQEWLDTRST